MHRSGKVRRPLAAVTSLLLAGAGLAACSGGDKPGDTVDTFLAGWQGGDLSKIGFVTAAGGRIAAADVQTELKALTGDLTKSALKVSAAGDAKATGDDATEPIKLDWTLPGNVPWSYQSTVRLTKRNTDGWRVVWDPTVLHEKLTAGDRLELRRTTSDRADVLGPDGQALVTARGVTTIGIEPQAVDDQAKLVKALATALKTVKVDLDQKDLTTRLRNADPGAFVDVITLRNADYAKIRSQVYDLKGTRFRKEQRELAPNRAFARAVLGTADPATRDDINAHPDRIAQGDQAGHGGLQEKYDDRLRGTAGLNVVIARKTPDDQVEDDAALFTSAPVAGQPIKLTLDEKTQTAADAAVVPEKQPSALVAIRISDSSVLAVTNGPDGAGVNTAMTGQVPPGSTFKMVTALGLLDKGAVSLDAKVECPKTAKVGGQEFGNSHDMALGSVPFRTDFAKSCNTAFVGLSSKLGADGLKAAAAEVGLEGKWDLGLESFSGKLSPADSPQELAAASFGQGATAMSPLALAAATAAVARGQFKQPRLVLDPAPAAPAADGPALKDGSVQALRTMMREVVTKGTGTKLKSVPGGPVSGKTGTAEFKTGSEDTHSWFVGWQGDVAFAVMVQNGGAGSEAAVPIVQRFLTALNK
ncbi:penicillin-binding transpeptidase domain-containing protein [Symbioplanes lichenis]|uniref:penicillin-binding transpeptidase domain-containing protein n=1 Tax=Symbioplanes lichenis TaxID=1629072 RepID=UPI0027383EDD|nr:penicillin-binding transpeptidase domain-containing protein [Actinoplanes lichenis]